MTLLLNTKTLCWLLSQCSRPALENFVSLPYTRCLTMNNSWHLPLIQCSASFPCGYLLNRQSGNILCRLISPWIWPIIDFARHGYTTGWKRVTSAAYSPAYNPGYESTRVAYARLGIPIRSGKYFSCIFGPRHRLPQRRGEGKHSQPASTRPAANTITDRFGECSTHPKDHSWSVLLSLLIDRLVRSPIISYHT